jgi:uncharacterized Zn-binding protein involved in type VI secretion
MTLPAVRIGDPTAHGGAVVSGCPVVLIGGMPAARVSDMHACPAVNGIVPHVGGPAVKGSPVVLVGAMPQVRVGDMFICVGPTASPVMGCPTVLVGTGGGGGAGGGGGGGGVAGAVAGALASGVRSPLGATSVTEQRADGSRVARVGECLRIHGDELFQALVVRDIERLRLSDEGHALLRSIECAGRRVRIVESAEAYARVLTVHREGVTARGEHDHAHAHDDAEDAVEIGHAPTPLPTENVPYEATSHEALGRTLVRAQDALRDHLADADTNDDTPLAEAV